MVPVDWPEAAGGLFSRPAERAYLIFAIVMGLFAGPAQAASRTLMTRLVSQDRITAYFGLYALSGKATAFLAPLANRACHCCQRSAARGAGCGGGFPVGRISSASRRSGAATRMRGLKINRPEAGMVGGRVCRPTLLHTHHNISVCELFRQHAGAKCRRRSGSMGLYAGGSRCADCRLDPYFRCHCRRSGTP